MLLLTNQQLSIRYALAAVLRQQVAGYAQAQQSSRTTEQHHIPLSMQAQDSAYKSTWRSTPSASQSGHGIPSLSSKATSLFEDHKVNKGLDQRLLQEDAIRQSGISGPLGMGVVMQSEFHTV